MDGLRLGTVVRALRVRKGLRQIDVARRASVSSSTVSRLERGCVVQLDVRSLLQVVDALGGRLDFIVRWQGGELDRLLNARHSALHEEIASMFRALSQWEIAPEVSYSIYGERGVIDILAWHRPTRTLLVIELKTEIVDVNELMGKVDIKRRLAPRIARERGWITANVAVWIVVADGKTNRRRVRAHATTLRAAFPSDGRAISGWLRSPMTSISCLSFWSKSSEVRGKSSHATVKRVRRRKSSVAGAS